MATTLQFRRGNNTTASGVTGANGEIYINTEHKTIHVHDGVTAGGFQLANASSVAAKANAFINVVENGSNVTIGNTATGCSFVTMQGTYFNMDSNITFVNGNLFLQSGLYANGSSGSSGQVLKTNGMTSYWANEVAGGGSDLSAIAEDVLPSFNDVFDLGSTAKRWHDVYLTGSVDINGATLSGNASVISTAASFVSNGALVSNTALIGQITAVSNRLAALNSYGAIDTLAVDGTLAVNGSITVNGTAIGSGLSGSSYVYVAGSGTPAENGAELVAAYARAKTMTPGGSPLSATNRVVVVVAPGNYTATFNADTDYIDVVSLTGEKDVRLSHINVSCGFGRFIGLDLGTNPFTARYTGNLYDANYFENCSGGDYSFGYVTSGRLPALNGTYKNCTAGHFSFGCCSAGAAITSNIAVGGEFIDCTAGHYSFGCQPTDAVANGPQIAGRFTRCRAGAWSFGYTSTYVLSGIGANLIGTFTDCTASLESFGRSAKAKLWGTYTRCTGGEKSFGHGDYVELSGTFDHCKAGQYSFGYGTQVLLSGTFEYCSITGSSGFNGLSFGVGSTAALSGVFRNCTSGAGSFGYGYGPNVSGTFIGCEAGENSFALGSYPVASGNFTRCIAGSNSFGGASGNFTQCIAGSGSFSLPNGKLYYCRLTSGTFPTVEPGGRTIYCIDGFNNTNNQ